MSNSTMTTELITRRHLGRVALVGAGIATSCGSVDPVALLGDLIDGVDVLLPLIPGIPAPIVNLVEAYAQQVLTVAQETATELASTDSTAEKAVKIAGYFATAVVPDLTGLAQSVRDAIQRIVTAIGTFLLQVTGSSSPTPSAAPQIKARAQRYSKNYRINRDALDRLHVRIDQDLVRLVNSKV